MRFEIEKRYAVLIFLGLLVLAGTWVVYAIDTSQGWHSWDQISGVPAVLQDELISWEEISGKPDLTSCSGTNQAIKTINLDTGAVTCEADDVGGGGAERGSAVYKVTNGYCEGLGFLTPDSTCLTKACGQSSSYYQCNGVCGRNDYWRRNQPCSNQQVGYLAN